MYTYILKHIYKYMHIYIYRLLSPDALKSEGGLPMSHGIREAQTSAHQTSANNSSSTTHTSHPSDASFDSYFDRGPPNPNRQPARVATAVASGDGVAAAGDEGNGVDGILECDETGAGGGARRMSGAASRVEGEGGENLTNGSEV